MGRDSTKCHVTVCIVAGDRESPPYSGSRENNYTPLKGIDLTSTLITKEVVEQGNVSIEHTYLIDIYLVKIVLESFEHGHVFFDEIW